MASCIPQKYYKDIFSINYELLKEKGISYLLIDLDNTIASVKEKEPSLEVQTLFKTLTEEGFHILIFSNSNFSRVKNFSIALNMDFMAWANKPFKYSYRKVMKKYKVTKEKIAAIGDQIFTDIKGANKMGIMSILVDPLKNVDGFFTLLNRKKEQRLWKTWEKSNGIKKGKYYE